MDACQAIADSPLFAGLPADVIARLERLAEAEYLAAGQRLYAEGDAGDALHLLVHGRLRVSRGGQLLSYVHAGEPVGEMALLAGEARAADVDAVRDCALLGFDGAALLDLLRQHPDTLLRLARTALSRSRQRLSQRRLAATEGGGCFAVLPASRDVPAHILGEALVGHLGGWPQARLLGAAHVDAALGEGRARIRPDDDACRELSAWLHRLESRHRYLVLVADNDHDGWAERCLRHADRILVLAEANATPEDVPALAELQRRGGLAAAELVLLRAEGDPAPHTLDWVRRTGARAHYFVHPWSEADLAALARQITGHGVGLVLGGGGARGFAHIGLIRALEQLEIPVDVCGGTSMGAFIAALLACGYDSVEIAHLARETFVTHNYLNDYTLPKVSLIRGHRFLQRLQQIFGEQRIEALRRSYYCVSTNLCSGATGVHDHGPLATWVATSMAVPGVAPPIAWQGELLCDGGVVDNLPTDVMQALERGSIIASNVGSDDDLRVPGAGSEGPDPRALFDGDADWRRPSLAEILFRTATLASDTTIQKSAIERADVYLRMPIDDIGMFDWERLDALVERGYRHAMEVLTPKREALLRRSLAPPPEPPSPLAATLPAPASASA